METLQTVRMRRACETVADKLDAWAEAHHAAAMRTSDDEYARLQQTIRDNYYRLSGVLRQAMA